MRKNGRIEIKTSIVRDVVMMALILLLLNPYLTFMNIWIIYGGLWIAWCVLALNANAWAFWHMIKNRFTISCFAWPGVILVLALLGRARFSFYECTVTFILFSFTYYSFTKEYDSLKVFVGISMIYVIAINIVRIIRLNEIPLLARILASGNKELTINYATPFTANFAHSNGLVFLTLALLYLLKTKIKISTRLMVVCIIILNAYTIIKTQYVLALLTLFAGAFAIFIHDIKNRRMRIILFLIVGLFGILFFVFYQQIFSMIAELLPQSNLRNRFMELAEGFTTETNLRNNDFRLRLYVYGLSISTFLQNPILGVGGSVYRANGLVGGHSLILDNYAYYGIFGGSVFPWMLNASRKNINSSLSTDLAGKFNMIWLFYIISCFINLCYLAEILIFVYFLVPSILVLMERTSTVTWDEKNEITNNC